jgi:hypothetical protein
VTARAPRWVALLTLALCAACGDVTPEKIARWKETERGPAKLRDAVGNGSLAPSLRAQALAALVELGMTSEAIADLQKSPDPQSVVREAVPRLAELAGKGSQGAETTRVQREAKDALFELRPAASDDAKLKLDEALIAWTTADLAGRMQQGGQSSDKILIAIGPRAVPRLLELTRTDGMSQLQAAAILGRMGDEKARTQAADALVDAAKRAAARTRDVPDNLLKAVSALGGSHATAFLVDQGEHGSPVVRKRALLALGQGASLKGDPSALAMALRIAGDKSAPDDVRDASFEVLEKIGPEAVPGLIKIMADPNLVVAERAVEAALAAGKEKAVGPVLDALPPKLTKKEDIDSYVVHDLTLIGAPAVPALQEAATKAKTANGRMAATRALAVLKK